MCILQNSSCIILPSSKTVLITKPKITCTVFCEFTGDYILIKKSFCFSYCHLQGIIGCRFIIAILLIFPNTMTNFMRQSLYGYSLSQGNDAIKIQACLKFSIIFNFSAFICKIIQHPYQGWRFLN